MWCVFVETGDENWKDALDRGYPYVIILSKYQGKILLSRHKKRETWETQGGHIEPGETPLQAAHREFFEESGAVQYHMRHVFDCEAGDETGGSKGMVFFAEVTELGPLPESEMAEVRCFEEMPENLTYPDLEWKLYRRACEMGLYEAQTCAPEGV